MSAATDFRTDYRAEQGAAEAAAAPHREAMQAVWTKMEEIPVEAYYIAVGASVLASLACYTAGKKDAAHFIGHWAPTFALLGLMNRLLKPAHER